MKSPFLLRAALVGVFRTQPFPPLGSGNPQAAVRVGRHGQHAQVAAAVGPQRNAVEGAALLVVAQQAVLSANPHHAVARGAQAVALVAPRILVERLGPLNVRALARRVVVEKSVLGAD